jgi:imidazolonepropionase-like amidohydrolase
VSLVGGLAIRAPGGWLGAGGAVRDVTVVVSGGSVSFAGSSTVAPDASEGPSFNGPLIRACGPMLAAVGAEPPAGTWATAASVLPVGSIEDAVAAVQDFAARGAGHIKVSLDSTGGPSMSDPVLAAITGSAEAAGVPVTAVCRGPGEVERALGAGVSELANTPCDERLSDSLLGSLAVGVRIVSTLDVMSFGQETSRIRIALDNLRRFIELGGTVVYGTDQGASAAPTGINERELLLLQETGMDVEAVLSSMIRAPLETGAPGDFMVVREDPFEVISTVTEPLVVVRAGRLVSG